MARKQKDIRIGDLQTRTIPAIPEHLSMAAARKVAALKQVEVLFVERDGRLVGALEEPVWRKAADDATVAASMTADRHLPAPGDAGVARARPVRLAAGFDAARRGRRAADRRDRARRRRARARPAPTPRFAPAPRRRARANAG